MIRWIIRFLLCATAFSMNGCITAQMWNAASDDSLTPNRIAGFISDPADTTRTIGIIVAYERQGDFRFDSTKYILVPTDSSGNPSPPFLVEPQASDLEQARKIGMIRFSADEYARGFGAIKAWNFMPQHPGDSTDWFLLEDGIYTNVNGSLTYMTWKQMSHMITPPKRGFGSVYLMSIEADDPPPKTSYKQLKIRLMLPSQERTAGRRILVRGEAVLLTPITLSLDLLSPIAFTLGAIDGNGP